MPSAWYDCLPTGWEPIDGEHSALVGRLAALLSAVNANDVPRARSAADELFREVADHFAHEERLMSENGYPQLSRHKEAHDLFAADVAEHAAEVATKGITAEFRRWATGRVLEWFRFHVAANDVALGAFLLERKRASRLRGGVDAGTDAGTR